MNHKFDELAKALAQSTTRRAALNKFGSGLAGIALAFLGLANNAQALSKKCGNPCDCSAIYFGCCPKDKHCLDVCGPRC